jgi:hypothetical protein
MKHALALLSLAALPGVAQAQDSTFAAGRLELVGVAPSACVIRTASGANGVNAVFEPSGTSSGRVRITEMVDPTSALPRATSMDLLVPIICNGPHRVTLRSGNGGLVRQGDPVQGNGFASAVPYNLGIAWGATQSNVTSDSGAPLVLDANEARAGQLSLQIAVARGSQPLVAGTYSDLIVLEFQAAN